MRIPMLSVALAVLAVHASDVRAPHASDAPAATQQAVRHGTVRRVAFHSEALGVDKHYFVYLPPSYDATRRRFPVVYYLNGVFGGEADWITHGHLVEVADSLVSDGKPEMIIVTPDGDDGFYTNWHIPASPAACADSILSEAPDDGCVVYARYDDYIAHDLVRDVDRRFRTRADRAHRAIAGLSMGGYGAIALALRHPDLFAAAASHSGLLSPLADRSGATPPAYFTSMDSLAARYSAYWAKIHGAFGDSLSGWRDEDPTHLAAVAITNGAELPALYFDVGRSDPYVGESRAFAFELQRLGIPYEYHEWSGSHTWRYWSTHVPESLAWIADRIGGRPRSR